MKQSERFSKAEANRRRAPILPFDRPPTRAEVWEYVQVAYDGLLKHDAMVARAKELWVGNYVYAVCINGWDKQPDWKEGDPVFSEAVPDVGDYGLQAGKNNARIVYEHFEKAKQLARVATW